jgi:O-antigen/teichoic acid export membrane protein
MPTALIADRTDQVIPSMVRSGAGTVASGLLALVATKILAVILGAPSVALLETLQQIRQIALVAATANGQTGLVQGASSLTGPARREYVRTILCVFAAASMAVAGGMLVWRERVARAAGLPQGSGRLVAMLVAAVVLSSGFVFLSGLLNVRGEIGRLAILQVSGAAVMALGAWAAAIAVRRGHTGALPTLLAVSALIPVAAAWKMIRLRQWLAGPGAWWTARAARHFFSVSGVMLATGLISTVGLLAVRGHIVREAGLEVTGTFDAAWAISANHVTLVLAALQTCYFPQLARARSVEQRERQMAAVFPVAILAATPVIVALAVLRPMALAALYSSAFHGASTYLRWTLIGDYFKVTAWVLAMPMLAAADMRMFLATDTLVQVVFVGASWALPAAGPESAAIGFTLSYVVCLALTGWYAARHVGFRPTRERAMLWLAGFSLVVLAAGTTWNDQSVSGPKAFAWIVTSVGAAAAGAWRLHAGKFRI